jgi:phosphoribosylformylglycinamidine synthase
LLERDGLILGICNGFQALIKLGLLPYGRVSERKSDSPTLSYNTSGAHVSRFVRTRIESSRSPWLTRTAPGAVHRIPVSHGEGRFIATPGQLQELSAAGQIAARYVTGENPNGSAGNVEALISPDGRILGKMGHSERIKPGLYRNIPGAKDQEIFRAGVEYFL